MNFEVFLYLFYAKYWIIALSASEEITNWLEYCLLYKYFQIFYILWFLI